MEPDELLKALLVELSSVAKKPVLIERMSLGAAEEKLQLEWAQSGLEDPRAISTFSEECTLSLIHVRRSIHELGSVSQGWAT